MKRRKNFEATNLEKHRTKTGPTNVFDKKTGKNGGLKLKNGLAFQNLGWVDGWMGGRMENKSGLRDRLAQSKNVKI